MRKTGRSRALCATVGAGLLTLGLSACAGDVPMQAAPAANDPLCAGVTVRLPDDINGLPKRGTNAQATGAWGNPASILLKCGTDPIGPTTDKCVAVNGVDWVIDESQAPSYRFIAYGREPGLEVIVDSEEVSGTEAVLALTNVAKMLPQKRQCLSVSDQLEDPQAG